MAKILVVYDSKTGHTEKWLLLLLNAPNRSKESKQLALSTSALLSYLSTPENVP